MEADKMILGNSPKAVYSTDCSKTGVNNNVIVCAGTGGGKTMSVTEPRLLTTYDSNLIVTCTKRIIVDKYRDLFEQRGYTVMDLNFTDPENSTVTYDPMKYIKTPADEKFLAEAIVGVKKDSKNSNYDPYWDDSAVALLTALITLTRNINVTPTFSDVLDMFDSLRIIGNDNNIETNLDDLFESFVTDKENQYAAACWETFRELPEKTARCVYGVLNTALNHVFSAELREMIRSKKMIDFKEFADNKNVLFISTSAVNPYLNCFVNIFYAQLFKQLFEYAESRPNRKLPRPVSVIADDFATGSRIQNFSDYISIFREKLISVTILLQSETQLTSMYGSEDAASIINNCDTYVYLGGMDLQTCENISRRANLPVDDILNMPVGREYIFRRGQKPIFTERYKTLEDEIYKEVTRKYEIKLAADTSKYHAFEETDTQDNKQDADFRQMTDETYLPETDEMSESESDEKFIWREPGPLDERRKVGFIVSMENLRAAFGNGKEPPRLKEPDQTDNIPPYYIPKKPDEQSSCETDTDTRWKVPRHKADSRPDYLPRIPYEQSSSETKRKRRRKKPDKPNDSQNDYATNMTDDMISKLISNLFGRPS